MNDPSNLLSELKPVFQSRLEKIYCRKEAENLINLLVEHYLGLTRSDQVLNAGFRLSESELLKLEVAMKRLLNSEPVQYVLGETDFYGLKFEVNPLVLIPRPETEELVDLIVQGKPVNKRILDIGTGSGCIAIALQKHLKKCRVTALDVSEKALGTARINARNNDTEVKFIKADIRENRQLTALGIFDIIVSNPPYVTREDKKEMHNNVLGWEPQEALFASEEDPLFFYKKILDLCREHLLGNGQIFLEINENFGQKLKTLLEANSYTHVTIHQDFRGKDRFIRAVKKIPASR